MDYDGTVRIDTNIDSKSFNDGMKKLTKSIGDTMKSILAGVTKAVANIAVIAGAVGAALVFALIIAIKFADELIKTLYKNLSITSAMREQVDGLKGAFDTLKGTGMALGATLLNAIAPVLLKIIDWLVRAVNWLSMFIAALTGQKTVMQYVSGATDSAAKSTSKLAKATKDTEKAAKGALAAFDELNVLQQDTADLADQETGGGIGGNIVMEEVPVTKPDWMESVLEWWASLKEKIGEVWNWIYTNVLEPFWGWLSKEIAPRVLTILIETFGLLIDIAKELWKIVGPILIPALTWLWEKVLQPIAQWTGGAIISILDWIIGLLKTMREGLAERGLMGMFQNLFKYVADTAKRVWEDIKRVWNAVAGWFKDNVINPLSNLFQTTWNNIRNLAINTWNSIRAAWQSAYSWFYNTIILPIRNAFDIALSAIKSKWETTFTGIRNFVKGVINSIIDFINGMIRGIAGGINAVISAINSIKITIPAVVIAGQTIFEGAQLGIPNIAKVAVPQIPRLATGAVIPPNSEFLALLGDQRSGRNIEAPEGLIRQIIQEEIGNIEANIQLEFGGTLGALVRELRPYINRENVRIGDNLVKGMVR